MTAGCGREKEVARLLELGQWPQACPDELRAHATGCRACSARVLVTQSFQAARGAAMAEAQLPSAGALWWRAQLRKRNEALVRVSRPMLGAQVFALAIAGVLALAAVALFVRSGVRLSLMPGAWMKAMMGDLRWSTLVPDALPGGAWWWVAPLVAMLVAAGGVVVYFATEKQ